MRLHVFAPVPAVQAAADDSDKAADRVLSGLALPYGPIGRTSAGPLTVAAGAVRVPTELRHVKLFREHGRRVPVGYATAAQDTPEGLVLSFHAARTDDGDRAVLEAREGVRDALSVELDNVTVDAGRVTAADLTAVALTSIPAFADARVVASQTPDAPDPDTADDADDDDTDDDTDDAADTDTEDEPMPETTTPPTPASRPPGALTARRHRRGLSLDAAMARVVAQVRGSTEAGAINAALSDITPAMDTSGGAFLRPQWVDELWTPVGDTRHYVNAIQSGVLTGPKVYGWKWGTKPVVGPYAGNKAAIPSNTVTVLPAHADAVRHAGGWDVDNIFVYLGDSSLLTSILQMAAFDYAQKQEGVVSAALQAAATDGGLAVDLPTALTAVAGQLGAIGATPSFVSIAPDLWGAYLSLTSADAPWWLTSADAGTVSVADGSARVGGLSIWADPNLAAGTVLGGDRRAATHYEPRGNPFRVQAVNLPNGGVDIGIFGFDAVLVNDARAIVTVEVGVTP